MHFGNYTLRAFLHGHVEVHADLRSRGNGRAGHDASIVFIELKGRRISLNQNTVNLRAHIDIHHIPCLYFKYLLGNCEQRIFLLIFRPKLFIRLKRSAQTVRNSVMGIIKQQIAARYFVTAAGNRKAVRRDNQNTVCRRRPTKRPNVLAPRYRLNSIYPSTLVREDNMVARAVRGESIAAVKFAFYRSSFVNAVLTCRQAVDFRIIELLEVIRVYRPLPVFFLYVCLNIAVSVYRIGDCGIVFKVTLFKSRFVGKLFGGSFLFGPLRYIKRSLFS